MKKENAESRIKSLKTQIKQYQQEINLIKEENRDYANQVDNLRILLIRKNNEDTREKERKGYSTVQYFKKTERNIKWLKNQVRQIQKEMRMLHNTFTKQNDLVKLAKETSIRTAGFEDKNHEGLTFRDLQRASKVSLVNDKKTDLTNLNYNTTSEEQINSNIHSQISAFTSLNEEDKVVKPPQNTIKKNNLSGNSSDNLSTDKKEQRRKGNLAFPFFKWK